MTNVMLKRDVANANEPAYLVDGIFNHSLRRFFDGNLWDAGGQRNRGVVPVNVRENQQQYQVDVIAPGCRKEDFKVQVQNNELQISCTQNDSKKQTDENAGWVRNEYTLETFSRHFTLDETVNVNNIQATYTDGILKVVLPKTEKAKPLQISIDVR